MKKLLSKLWLQIKAMFFVWTGKGFKMLGDKFDELNKK